MADIFISYSQEDTDVVGGVAAALERAGYSTWYYTRDSDLAEDYLKEIGDELSRCRAVVFVISDQALDSSEVYSELVEAHRLRRVKVPLLRGITHEQMRQRSAKWAIALGGAVGAPLPPAGWDYDALAARIVKGLRKQGLEPPDAAVEPARTPVHQRQEPEVHKAPSESQVPAPRAKPSGPDAPPPRAESPTDSQPLDTRSSSSSDGARPIVAPAYQNAIDGYEMALIPAGKAIFRSREGDAEAYADEDPQFELEIPPFLMGLFCVTNVQYAKFLTAAGASASDLEKWILLDSDCHVVKRGGGYGVDDDERYGDHPVVQVSWYGAEAYCQWAGLRLPTELEWEKGARGWEGYVYPWGNKWEPDKCRWDGNKGNERTCRVWEYPEGVSRFGLYNMSGNVWEWTADWYDAGAYKRYAAGDLTSPGKGERKALRGGSWDYYLPWGFRAAHRPTFGGPSYRIFNIGFRCARGL